ncbi:hypothetical protein AB0L40_19900 [Patulibacter sp. NPDC049589]|uniref:hypothetical protein n=1 Tax=Patulibacter sp. NPDC049589 TaxID=3154731 RepID=UPI003436B506
MSSVLPAVPRPRPRRRVLATALAACTVAAGALTGCGGQAQQVRDALAYSQRVNEVQRGFERDLTDLRRAANEAEVLSDVDRAVRRLSASVDGVQRGLRAVEPPSPVTGLHGELIDAFGRWSAPLRRFLVALRTKRPATIKRAQDRFIRDTDAVQRRVGDTAQRINVKLRGLSD